MARTITLVLQLVLPLSAAGTCIDFEAPLVLGTRYGSGAPNAPKPGNLMFTTHGVPLTIDEFIFAAGGTGFNFARIDNPPHPFASGQSLGINNVNVDFDFRHIGPINRVTLAFLNLGGYQNLSVNGGKPYVGRLEHAPPSIDGVTVAVTTTPVPGGVAGTLTLTGPIAMLGIGGQELWIDDVCAK